MMRIGGVRVLHGADLHRRGVGAQHHAALPSGARRQVEGVVHLPRRMLRRDVERGEIVEIVLDVRALRRREAHLAEDRDDLVDGLADRMDAALGSGPRRQGDVEPLGGEPARRARGLGQRRLARLDRRGDRVLDGVERWRRPRAAPRAARPPSVLHQLGDLALLAQRLDARAVQRRQIGGGRDLPAEPRLEFVKFLVHALRPSCSRAAS